MSDLLLQEIDEELRRDKALAFWKRHGALIAGVAVAFVVLVAGWRGYDSWQRTKAAEDGDRIFNLLEASEKAASNEILKQLDTFAASATKSAATLARFRVAIDEARLGDAAAAIKSFDVLANDFSLDSSLRDMARIRAARLLLEQGDADGAIARVLPLAIAGNELRHAARELLGLAAYKKKDLAGAVRWFDALVTDLATPPATRNRGQMMLALLAADGMTPDVPSSENPQSPEK